MHGYDIAEYIEKRSEQVLGVEEGALYPALHRLEVRGLLAAEWGVSDNNRTGEILQADSGGTETARGRNSALETHVFRDCEDSGACLRRTYGARVVDGSVAESKDIGDAEKAGTRPGRGTAVSSSEARGKEPRLGARSRGGGGSGEAAIWKRHAGKRRLPRKCGFLPGSRRYGGTFATRLAPWQRSPGFAAVVIFSLRSASERTPRF